MLSTVLETLDGVDDAAKPFYTESDGKFVLQISGVDSHPDVANLKSAYERTKGDLKAVRAERDSLKDRASAIPDDFDAEKWAKVKDGKPDEAALISLRKELEADRDQWKTKAETAIETARQNALDRDLTDALNAAGITNPAFTKAARLMHADRVKIGDDGKAFVETDMGPLPVSDFIKRWAAGSEGAQFVKQPKGGGADPGNGTAKPNAEAFKAMGDKERVALFRDNPDLFRELSGQA